MRGAPNRAEDLLIGRRPAFGVRAIVGGVLLATFLALAHAFSLDERVRALLDASRAAGPAGVLLHLVAYLCVGLLALPASPLTAVAGATWGTFAGAALGVAGVTVGACAAFLVGRLVARDPDALASGEGRIARAARAIGRGGLRLVLLLRLAPVVPFSVLNFAFGATPTRLSHFALGSLAGTIPSQLGYAFLGAVLAWPPGPRRTWCEIALVAGAVLLTALATGGVVRLLRHPRSVSAGERS